MRVLVAIPVYNEEKYVPGVLARVREYADDILVVDDGSTDRTPDLVNEFDVATIRHERNRGYGHSLQSAFSYAAENRFDTLITMDCDEQHEPASIPAFIRAASTPDASGALPDIVSGSRYLDLDPSASPPADRREINGLITSELNERLGLNLTDAFCGFKAYRVAPLSRLRLNEDGYAFPMQFWVQAVANGLRITEIPVRLIYVDENRSFGGPLDDPTHRLMHYRRVLHCELERCADRLPAPALHNLLAGSCCDE